MKVVVATGFLIAIIAVFIGWNAMKNKNTLRYDIILDSEPSMNKTTFDGVVQISEPITENVSELKFDAVDISVLEYWCKISGFIGHKFNCTIEQVGEQLIVRKNNNEEFQKGTTIVIKIHYHGKVSTSMNGLYRSKFADSAGNEHFITSTQLEPSDARRVFPCHDTPNRKAIFKLSLITYPDETAAISNTVLESRTFLNSTRQMCTFRETPPMSTYLFAFVKGNLEETHFFADQKTKVRIYVPKDTNRYEALFGSKIAERALEYFSKYFEVKYPFPKLDLVAIPDFAPGAMENWGLITFRTSALLRSSTTRLAATQRIGYIIAHEIAHQWFGDLVTMKQWRDLWLNEGFATFMGSKMIHETNKHWNYWNRFIKDEMETGLHLDSLMNSHPIIADIQNDNQIGEIFDAISYSKGGSLIQMLHGIIGEKAFKDGLVLYMKKYAYKNTDSQDLFACWDQFTPNFNVTKFMTFWLTHKGYPYIDFSISKGNKLTKVHLKQQQFTFNKDVVDTLWPIPLFALQKNNTNSFAIRLMTEKELEFDVENNEFANFVKLNKGRAGFYRVHYDKASLETIFHSEQLLAIEDKLGLLLDSFAFSKAGISSYSETFDMINRFSSEEDPEIWKTILENILSLSYLFSDNKEIVSGLKLFARQIAQEKSKQYGWSQPRVYHQDDMNEVITKSAIFELLAFAEDNNVIEKAKDALDAALSGSLSLSFELRNLVFAINAADDTKAEKMKLAYSAVPIDTQIDILKGLGNVKTQNIATTLDWAAFSGKVRAQDFYIIFNEMAKNNKEETWKWLTTDKNWKWICSSFSFPPMLARILSGALSNFSHLELAEDFFKAKEADLVQVNKTLLQIKETITINSNWRKQSEQQLIAWVKNL